MGSYGGQKSQNRGLSLPQPSSSFFFNGVFERAFESLSMNSPLFPAIYIPLSQNIAQAGEQSRRKTKDRTKLKHPGRARATTACGNHHGLAMAATTVCGVLHGPTMVVTGWLALLRSSYAAFCSCLEPRVYALGHP